MPAFDLRSLTAMSGVMAVVLGLVLLGVRANYPSSIRGLSYWGSAPLWCALSALIFVLGGVLPGAVSLLVGNGLLMLGFAFFLFGSQRFLGQPVAWRSTLCLAATALAVMAFFKWVQPDYRIRVLVFTTALTLMCLAHIGVLLRHGKGFANWLVAGMLGMQVLVLLSRGLSSLWLDRPDTGLFDPSWAQMAYLGAYSFSVLLVSVGVLLMASERVRSEFEHLATHDGLTGAFTRRAVLEMAEVEMQRWLRYQQQFAVLMLDIDHFKQVNDTHGHLVGDAVLRDVAAKVGGALRVADRLGRFGGEEFVVILPAADLAAAVSVAERIAATVRDLPAEPGRPRCTVSIGAATVQADDTLFDQVLARADAALYLAKKNGRDQVAVLPAVVPPPEAAPLHAIKA